MANRFFMRNPLDTEWTMVVSNGRIEGFATRRGDVLVWRESWSSNDNDIKGQLLPAGFQLVTNDPESLRLYGKGRMTKRIRIPVIADRVTSVSIGTKSNEGHGVMTGDGLYRLANGQLVIGHANQYWGFTSFQDYINEMVRGEYTSVSVPDDTGDDSRRLLSGFVGKQIPTQAEAKRRTAAVWEKIDMELEAERIVREGRQVTDTEKIVDIPDVVTADNSEIWFKDASGKTRRKYRLKSVGFTVCDDFGKDFKQLLIENGGQIIYDAPAISHRYVGTVSGALREMKYRIDGVTRWAYIALHSGGDSWEQECWTANHRLSGSAAADTILAARRLNK